MPHELLKEVRCEDVWQSDDLEGIGFELMEIAADMGEQSAIFFVAEAYERGQHPKSAKLQLLLTESFKFLPLVEEVNSTENQSH